MPKSWAVVRLGEVLALDLERVPVDPSKSYPMVGVFSFGKGLFERETIENGKTSYRVFYRLKSSHVVMSQLFGWEGALALSSEQFEGRYLSPQFPTFLCDPKRLDRAFFGWLIRRPSLWADLGLRASGMGDRRRTLTPDALFACEVPLPPLAEQRRVVARIEELAARIQEARALRVQATVGADALSASLLTSILPKGVQTRPLRDLIASEKPISYGVLVPGPDVEDGVPFVRVQDLALMNPTTAPNKRIAKAVEAPYARTRLQGGEILVGVVGSIGKVGIAPPSWAGANIARAVCRIAPSDKVNRDYLALVLTAQPSQAYFRETTRTLAQPTLNIGQLAQTPIPLPPLAEQVRLVRELQILQAQVESLNRLQSETADELDALLPAILDRAFKGEL